MRKLKHLIWLFAFLMLGWTANAQFVQLGSGTGTQYYIPMYGYYDYNYTQVIYTAAELLAANANASGGTIEKISYLPSNTVAATTDFRDWEIYMANTTKVGFSGSTDWIAIGNFTKVFDGQIPANTVADTWMQLVLTTPFVWDGTSNLAIAVIEKTPSYASPYPTWRSYTKAPSSGSKAIYKYQDATVINPASPPSGSTSNNVPQIRLEGTGLLASCLAPSGLAVSNLSASGATVSWTASGSNPTGGYEIYYSTSNTPPTGSTSPLATTGAGITTINISGLTDNTTYYVWVRSNCGGGDVSGWSNLVSFKTTCLPMSVLPYTINFESVTVPALPDCTSVQNAGTGNVWATASNPGSGFTGQVLKYTYNTSNAANTWFYTQGIQLTGGHAYNIQYRYGNNSTTYTEKMKVAYGSHPVNTSMTEIIADYPAIKTSTAIFDEKTFTPASDGVYYFGFQCYSIANQLSLYLDDISIFEAPTCIKPDNLVLGSVTATSAVINWNASVSNPTGGYEIYYSTSNTPPTGSTLPLATTGAGVTTATISGLSDNTTYYVWVRSNCGGGDVSLWSNSISFKTLCLPISTYPYLESFSATMPGCWFASEGASGASQHWGPVTADASNGAAGPQNGTHFMRLNVYNAVTTYNPYYLTTGFFALTGSKKLLSYYYFLGNGGYTTTPVPLTVQISNDGGATWTDLYAHTSSNSTFSSTGNGWYINTIDLTAYTGQTVMFRFKSNSNFGSGRTNQGIDEFSIYDAPACLYPSNLGYSNLTTTSVTINWDASSSNPANGYEIYYSTNATPPIESTPASTSVAAGITTVSITGLSDNTTYYVWVRSNCGSGDVSDWLGSISFKTPCNPFAIPYFEGFESGYTHDVAIAGCLSQEGSAGSGTWKANNTLTTYNRTPRTGSWNAFLAWSNTRTLFIPVQLVAGVNYVAEVYARQDASSGASLNIKYGTANNLAAMTNTIVANVDIVAGNYQEVSGTFSVPADGVYYIGIGAALTSTPYYISIDDIAIYEAPSCVKPDNLILGSVNATSAIINWNASLSDPANGYEIYYSTSNTPPTGATLPLATTGAGVTTATISGLSDNTTYYVWVRSNCGAGDLSDWFGSISFKTPCNPYTIPYFEGFESGYTHAAAIAGCLSQQGSNGSISWTANNTLTDYNRTPRTGSWNAYLQYSNTRTLFIPVQLQAGVNYVAEVYARQDGSTGASLNIKYGTANNLAAMTNTIVADVQIVAGDYQEISGVFNVPADGVYYIGIGGQLNFTPWYISIDDIAIYEAPSCIKPVDLDADDITATSAKLTWVHTATQFELEWGTMGFTLGNGTLVTNINNTEYNLSGLTPATAYDFYVRAICGAGDESDWAGPFTFGTDCSADPYTLPFFEDFEGVVCWSIADLDADGNNWNLYINENHTPGGGVAAAHSWFDGDQDGLLITPEIVLPANSNIQFSFWTMNEYPGDMIIANTVLVSTDNFATAPTLVWTENNAIETWKQVVVDLSQFAGETVKIGFRYQGDFAHRWWVDDVEVKEIVYPTINPVSATYDISNTANVTTTITWNDATSLVSIVDNQTTPYTLIANTDYELSGNTLTINTSYLNTVLNTEGDAIVLTANFDLGFVTFTINAIDGSIVPATINPIAANFDLGNPAAVTTTITWNDATSIVSVVDNQTTPYTLIANADYEVNGNTLSIHPAYLENVLEQANDVTVLTITFDEGVATFTITAIGEVPQPVPATINPVAATFDLGNPAAVTTTITWNDATSVVSVVDNQTTPYTLIANADYEVNGNTLSIHPAYLENVLEQANDVTVLTITFDEGVATFTITAIGEVQYDNATITPTSNTFNLDEPVNVEFEIEWNDATEIISIVDNQTAPYTLVAGTDYLLVGNELSIVTAYLQTLLTESGDIVELVVTFDHGVITLTITATGGNSIVDFAYNVKLYPNPTKGEFVIEVNENVEMFITDIAGRVIASQNLVTGVNNVVLTDQPAGTYFVNLVKEDITKTFRIVIEK